MKEIKLMVTPYGESMKYYCIQYKRKGFFTPWLTLVKVHDGAYLTYDQPILYPNFDDAVKHAERLKANPSLIDEHYEEQNKIYREAKQRRDNHIQERNKTKII